MSDTRDIITHTTGDEYALTVTSLSAPDVIRVEGWSGYCIVSSEEGAIP